jgi:3',5'-cyclic AMP phosphodiesterase CpdA
MDVYLKTLRRKDIPVYALLGNHDVLLDVKRGERNFNLRFPDQVNTGFHVIVDSIAVVMLNSNFMRLSTEALTRLEAYYSETLHALDNNPAIKLIIVTCHHAPYSNSAIVGSSTAVQREFVPQYLQSKKAKLFITGHAHAFERFIVDGKDFVTIGGGGGVHHRLNQGYNSLPSQSGGYNPEFFYLLIRRMTNEVEISTYALQKDFSGFTRGYQFTITLP